MHKKVLLCAATAIAVMSCVKEAPFTDESAGDLYKTNEGSLVEKTFTASVIPESELSKTLLGHDNFVLWSEGDKLAIFDYSAAAIGKCCEPHTFHLTSGAGSTKGTFTGKIHESDKYCALVINSDKEVRIDGNSLQAYLPSSQKSENGSFQEGLNAAWGMVDNLNDIKFYNLAALAKISVSSDDICSIRISSNDGSAMTGTGIYAFDGENPLFTNCSDVSFVEIKPASDPFFTKGETYYALIFPGTHNAGFTIEYRRLKDGAYQIGSISASKAVSLNKSQIINFGSPDTKITNWGSLDGAVIDFRFNEDGSATDLSSFGHELFCEGGIKLSTEFNREFNGYVAKFDNLAGVGASDGFYKYDYSADSDMKAILSASQSWEVYAMPNDTTGWWSTENPVKVWGTTQGGGSGIYWSSAKAGHAASFCSYSDGGAFSTANSGVNCAYGKFVHIVGTYDASAKTTNIYINGVLKKSVSTTATLTLPAYSYSQWIGLGADPSDRPNRTESAFNGYVAVARLYAKALSASEVKASYDAIRKISDSNDLLFSIKYNTDGTASDASRFSRKVETIGRAPYVNFDIEANANVAVYSNDAGASTSNCFHQFSYSSDASFRNAVTANHTIELYCELDELPDDNHVKIFSSTHSYGISVAYNKAGYFTYEAYDSGQSKFVTLRDSGFTPVAGKYYHIVGTFDGKAKTLTLYRDGQKVAEGSVSGSITLPSAAAAQRFCIGADPTGTAGTAENALKGNVALANIYGKALTGDEVAKLYSSVRKISNKKLEDKAGSDLLLDVRFRQNGEAYDNSSYSRILNTVPDTTMTTMYDGGYGDYVARFIHKPGSKPSKGYTEFNYKDNTEFKAALENGFTLETYVSSAMDPTVALAGQMCCVSGMSAGGLSIFIPKGTGTTFKFGVYTTPDGGSGSYKNVDSKVVPEKNRYYHVVGVYDKDSEKAKIYVDGVLAGTLEAPGSYNHPSTDDCHRIVIGSDPSATATEQPFNGTVAFARIYDAPKTDAEVTQLYNGLRKASNANLLLDVKFNKDWEATDASGRNCRIERVSGFGAQTWYSREFDGYVAFLSNKMGVTSINSGYFKYDYSTDPSVNGAFRSGVFSIEAYMSVDCSGGSSVKYVSAQESGGFSLYLNGNGKFAFQVVTNKGGATSNVTANSQIIPEVKRYYHVVGVVDYPAGKVSIYVDGKLENSATMSYKYRLPANSSYHWLGIGCDAGPTGQCALYGDIASVKLYGTALTASQVSSLWNELNKISKNPTDRPKKVSVIGDSISTFNGFTGVSANPAYRCDYPNTPGNTGAKTYCVTEVYQTYWWQLAYNYMENAMFDTNIAYSGSTVCHDGHPVGKTPYPCFVERFLDYGIGNPDIVVIHGGTNDWNHNYAGLYDKNGTTTKSAKSPIPDDVLETLYADRANLDIDHNFAAGYIKLLYLVKTTYPNAKPICVIGDFLNAAVEQTIIKICNKFGVPYVDLFAVNGFNDLGGKTTPPFEQPNMPKHDFDPLGTSTAYPHPNKKAMEFIANKIYSENSEYLDN